MAAAKLPFPPEYVHAAINASIPLAHHVDIGVAQWRAPIDLEWFDWLIEKLGGKDISNKYMHIEAIAWAALAMKIGGGYLDPQRWVCWYRSPWKRVLLKSGVSGVQMLQKENLASAKCLHAGGMSKWWVVDACKTGILDFNNELKEPSGSQPFVELTPQMYQREQQLKGVLRKVGFYSLFSGD